MDTTARPYTTLHKDALARDSHSPAYQAYQVLHATFVALPVLAGLDKFASLLTNWDDYLARAIAETLPLSTHGFMMLVGAVEIVAGLIVALRPRIGAYVVAAWLGAVILNLLISRAHFDVALRDLGLLLGAIALGRLAIDYEAPSTKVAGDA